jgi:hypothetical protein
LERAGQLLAGPDPTTGNESTVQITLPPLGLQAHATELGEGLEEEALYKSFKAALLLVVGLINLKPEQIACSVIRCEIVCCNLPCGVSKHGLFLSLCSLYCEWFTFYDFIDRELLLLNQLPH